MAAGRSESECLGGIGGGQLGDHRGECLGGIEGGSWAIRGASAKVESWGGAVK